MTFSWIGLALASQARNLAAEYPDGDLQLEHAVDAWAGPLAPARATLPELVRDLVAQGVPSAALPVAVVEDRTDANPVARGRNGQVRNGVGGECHGMVIRAPAGTLVTVTRLTFESPTTTADVAIFGDPLRGMQTVPGYTSSQLGSLSLTVARVQAKISSAEVAAPIVALGVPMPFGLDEHSPLLLRGHPEFDTQGEALVIFARSPNVETRWIVEWSEEPLPLQAFNP